MKADHRGDRAGEQGEAPRDEAGLGAVRAHRPHQRGTARREAQPLGDQPVDRRDRNVLQQRNPLAQGRLEGDLAPHRALGDRRHVILEAERSGELVDAFLLDHGRVHVGQEQALAPVRVGGEHREVDRLTRERRPERIREGSRGGVLARHRQLGRDLPVQDRGWCSVRSTARASASTASVMDGRSGFAIRTATSIVEVRLARPGRGRGAPGGDPHRRAHRVGQVGAGRPAGRTPRRRGDQHRFHAGLCGSAPPDRPARPG